MSTEQTGRRSRRAPAENERQRDPERTKARIVEAAVEEFSAKGFAGARVSAIAQRAGVNQQLIAYYFDGKEGLYRELARRWREFEADAFPDDMSMDDLIKGYVRVSVDHRNGSRLLAWEGLGDPGRDEEDPEEAQARNTRLAQEVAQLRARQEAGELDDRLDPAALHLIMTAAANALTVYPQLARGTLGDDSSSPDVVEHFAEQLALLVTPRESRSGT